MKKLQKDLKAILKTIYSLAQKVEKMQKDVKSHLQVPTKPKRKVKKKKAPAKKIAARQIAPPTAIDTIYTLIKKSKKRISTKDLMTKTGYERKSVSNVIYRLTKQGKIKTVAKGIYVKA